MLPTSTIQGTPTPVLAGTSRLPSIAIPSSFTTYQTGVDTSLYAPTDVITIGVEFSQDNGVTWHFDGAWTGVGGAHKNRLGVPALPGVFGSLPPDIGQGVLVRSIVSVPSSATLHDTIMLS